MNERIPLAHNAEHWKQRASETRKLADAQPDDETKRALLEIASEFDKLAQRADRRRQSAPDTEDA